jgi:hypothetical protein
VAALTDDPMAAKAVGATVGSSPGHRSAYLWVLDYRAKYADGTPLPRDAKEPALGLWRSKREGSYDCFLVETRSELDQLSRSDSGDSGERHTSGSGNGGGRGRRVAEPASLLPNRIPNP